MAFTLTFLPLCSLFADSVTVFGNAKHAAKPPYKNFAPQLFSPPPFACLHLLYTDMETHSTVEQSMELQRGAMIVLVNVLRCVPACPQD